MKMFTILAFLMPMTTASAAVLAALHIGFALIEDSYPRSAWDWYVVATCISFIITSFPAAYALGRWEAEKRVSTKMSD